jgi:hypothetical protein
LFFIFLEIEMAYNLVSPENFTEKHETFLESVKGSFRSGLYPPGFVSGIKDINSRHVITTDYFGMLVGLSCGEDIAGHLDRDLPAKVSELAQDFVDEDQELLSHRDIDRKSSLLNINQYSTGIKALLTEKYPLIHKPSQSILGIIFLSNQVDLSHFFTLMPNYILDFGIHGNIQNVSETLIIGKTHLTEYEHEVAFLRVMNWHPKQITHFMNQYRPSASPRTMDAIYKCLDIISHKFYCDPKNIREKLIEIGLHRKIPSSFFDRLIGNRVLY